MKKTNIVWDVVVIGGGPAGMMAAGRAAETGSRVLLLEKNATLGKKLLITGGGRCNVTNNKATTRSLIAKYKGNPKFLFSAFAQFSVEDTLNFFHVRGMPTKEEAEERVFPVSNKAQSVWDVLARYMKDNGVHVQTNTRVTSLRKGLKTKQIIISVKNKPDIAAKACIVATGGKARPETGSTGEGFEWLKSLGHTVAENSLALVPIALSDSWAKKIAGVTLRDIKLSIIQNNTVADAQIGKILFTHVGISGPTVLNMSKLVGELLQQGEVTITLDLFPARSPEALRDEMQKLLVTQSNKKIKNTLGNIVPTSLVAAVLGAAEVDGDTFNHSVRQQERKRVLATCKALPMHVKGLLGRDKAVVSSGGVNPKEIDFKTMQSRLVPNLYLVGDVIDIDRPSGGYSLQLCWTTGFVAGNSAGGVRW